MHAKEIHDLEIVEDGISIVKSHVRIGIDMSQAGFNIMHLVHEWVKDEVVKLKNENIRLTDIILV